MSIINTELVFIERQFQIVVQDQESKKALAFLQIFLNGQSGTIYSLFGSGLAHMIRYFNDVFDRFNLKELLFVCEDPVLEKISKNFPEGFYMEEKEKIEFSDKPMTSVVVRRIQNVL